MIFSGKLFAIIGTVLAVTAGGFPIQVAERELQPVRSFHIPSPSTLALPGPHHDESAGADGSVPPKRSLGNVYFCTDNGFQGTCNLFGVENDVCNNVPDGFNDVISAFGPDRGIGCELFECVDYSVTVGLLD
jgi:hypothetical protein